MNGLEAGFNDFKPYALPKWYKIVVSKDELVLLQTVRDIGYGRVTAHMAKNEISRIDSEVSILTKEQSDKSVTIAFEVAERSV